MYEPTGRDVALMRQAHALRQIDVGRAMVPPVSKQRVQQLEHRRLLTTAQFGRIGAAILAVSR